ANGNISAETASVAAITAPTVSLTALGGNISADGSPSGGHLRLNSGGSSGLSLFARATTVSSAGGVVDLLSTNNESVTLANSNPLSAQVAFALQVSGNLLSNIAGNTALASPVISLTSQSGNIGSGADPIRLNNGGSGLSLF